MQESSLKETVNITVLCHFTLGASVDFVFVVQVVVCGWVCFGFA